MRLPGAAWLVLGLNRRRIRLVATETQVRLHPFDAARDCALIEQWLRAPHGVRWWGNPEHALREVLRPARGGGDALIVVGATPVGYVRWLTPARDELDVAGLHHIFENAVDIDMAIGEPGYLGRGVASQALRLLVRRLRSADAACMLMMCTSVYNTSAIRACERAGFERDRVFSDPEFGDMWLLTIRSGSKPITSTSDPGSATDEE